jgi:hypothetical protein
MLLRIFGRGSIYRGTINILELLLEVVSDNFPAREVFGGSQNQALLRQIHARKSYLERNKSALPFCGTSDSAEGQIETVLPFN